MTQADPRSTGVPKVKDREAELDSEGHPTSITLTVVTPDGDTLVRVETQFSVTEGEATLEEVKPTDLSDGTNPLSPDIHLPAVLTAEEAVRGMELIQSVKGIRALAAEASTQATEGYHLECIECDETTTGAAAEEAGEPEGGLNAGHSCPNCGATPSNLVHPLGDH